MIFDYFLVFGCFFKGIVCGVKEFVLLIGVCKVGLFILLSFVLGVLLYIYLESLLIVNVFGGLNC